MKINCYTDYESFKGYVAKYQLREYPDELYGDYKYVFPIKVFKTDIDRNGKTINKCVFMNIYCFSDTTAEIARGLKEGDFIQVDCDSENLKYELDDVRYMANVHRACRISVMKKPEELNL